MADERDLPYRAEYAKSDRSSCKGCKRQIHKESLRLATLVQSISFDGKMTMWFHFDCFWKRAKPSRTSDIAGFDALRWDDQQKIKAKLPDGCISAAGSHDVVDSGKGGAAGSQGYDDYAVEYAKSAASTCRKCLEKIAKGEVRLSRKEYDSPRAVLYGAADAWYHVKCFVENRTDLGFDEAMSPSKILRFDALAKEDQQMVEGILGKGKHSTEPKKDKSKKSAAKAEKRKPDTVVQEEVKGKKAKVEENAEAAALKEQSDLLWSLRDSLQKDVSSVALAGLLEYNGQDTKRAESELLDRVADGMAFGALSRCPECKDGQLVYRNDGYHCEGHLSGWTKCQYVTRTPQRTPFKVPKEYHDVPFLKMYKYVKRQRTFPAETVKAATLATPKEPLRNMTVVLFGECVRPRKEMKEIVESFGGAVAAKVTSDVKILITTPGEVAADSKKIKDAKKFGVFVVSEDFLDAVRHTSVTAAIKDHRLTDWGGDPSEKIVDAPGSGPAAKSAAASKKEAKADALYAKDVSKKLKVTVKGGAAIDPDSGLADTAHLVQEKGYPLNAVLCLADVSSGANSYYRLQALEADEGKKWWVFRAWGRLGTVIGSNKLQRCSSRNEAVELFKDVYLDKTGNTWEGRMNFVKQPNRFYPIDVDYGQDYDQLKSAEAGAGLNSKLHAAVQSLMKMIFDIESMKAAMVEFEIDVKKVPLGKLTKKQIQNAYAVLKEIQELVDKKGTATQLLDASNRFYNLIPHDFGMRKPPLIESADLVQAKREMLDNLLEIEVAYNLLKSGRAEGKDPLDSHYESLNTDIGVLDKSSKEYTSLQQYVQNTHAATHSSYSLDVEEVYTVNRAGERSRYRPFRDLHNRKLLWHGSRITNTAGILSQGLKIAPPEAPVTGYMFGKGIYFADMVSKSANYCYATRSNPYGLLLLCEVALGDMHMLAAASNVTSLPKGKHSVKGCGMTAPDPKTSITLPDGVEIPAGTGIKAEVPGGSSSLLYNEYVVYDVAQVNIKYLMKVKFNWKM